MLSFKKCINLLGLIYINIYLPPFDEWHHEILLIHFSGTIQIQKRQQLVRKIHEDELNDMKDYLSQCQQEQETFIDYKVHTTNKLYKKDLLATKCCAVQISTKQIIS